jgi:hypothetical protein
MRRFASHLVSGAAAALVVALSIVSCGGSSGSNLFGPADDSGSGSEGGGGGIDGASGPDGTVATDGATGVDGSTPSTVNELPSPDCHDLAQKGDLIKPVGNASSPPPAAPLATMTLGTYVIKEWIDYNGASPIPGGQPFRTTVHFTATKQYYLSEDEVGTKNPLTLDWTLNNGRLKRTIVCAKSGVGTNVDYRIDTSPNGFTVYVQNNSGGPNRTSAYRYEKVD